LEGREASLRGQETELLVPLRALFEAYGGALSVFTPKSEVDERIAGEEAPVGSVIDGVADVNALQEHHPEQRAACYLNKHKEMVRVKELVTAH